MEKKEKTVVKGFLSKLVEKVNKLYIAIVIMVLLGFVLLAISFIIAEPDMKNIAVSLGTGVVTSALVTLYIEFINSKIQRKKLVKYKQMLLNPLFNAVKSLYVQAILSVNEYRVREQISGYLLLPMEDTEELTNFFKKMKDIDIKSIEDENKRKRLEDFSYVAPAYFKEVISQYEGLPFESLILDNIISQEEYEKLKHFTLFNESVKCLNKLNDADISEQDEYYTRVHLLHCMLLFINRVMKIFDFIARKIEYENERIKNHLSNLYFDEIHSVSQEYIQQQLERAEAEAEYYAEHPELLENIEESEEEQLYRKIDIVIFAGDVESIKQAFQYIDKDDKRIQSLLTGNIARTVMKNRELRRLYYEKYGVKYKIRREKRRRK